MTPKSRFYNIDNVLEGYNSFDKLGKVFTELKEELPLGKPFKLSPDNVVRVVPFDSREQYGWEMYRVSDSLLMIEYTSNWGGWAHQPRNSPKLNDEFPEIHGENVFPFNNLKITVFNPTDKIHKTIENIIEKYPRRPAHHK